MKKNIGGILKNADKFGVLKMASGLNLQEFKTSKRTPDKNSSSTSIEKFEKVWFNLPNGKGIFKTFDSVYNKKIKDVRLINELLCQELLSFANIAHAKYEPAHLDEEYGLISYNVLKPKQKLVTLAQYLNFNRSLSSNLVDISIAFEHYEEKGYVIDKEQVILDLYKIIVFDILTFQTDRHSHNINFIFDDNNLEICVAPLIDNEYAFGIEQPYLIQKSSSFNELIQQTAESANRIKSLDIAYERYLDEKYKNNIFNVCNLAKSNKQMMEFLTNALRTININKAIKNVEQQGFIISDEYKQYLAMLLSKTKAKIKYELSKPKDEYTTMLYDDYLTF